MAQVLFQNCANIMPKIVRNAECVMKPHFLAIIFYKISPATVGQPLKRPATASGLPFLLSIKLKFVAMKSVCIVAHIFLVCIIFGVIEWNANYLRSSNKTPTHLYKFQ